MKEIIQEYGSLLLAVIGTAASFAIIGFGYLSGNGALAALVDRFLAYLH